MQYLHIRKLIPLGSDVEEHPVHGPVEGDAAAEKDGQDHVGKQRGEVHGLKESNA